jgi:hypothetical protein
MRKTFFICTAILCSTFLVNEVHAQSRSSWLGYVQNLLQRQGRVIVRGNPLVDTVYVIDGFDGYLFAGEGCIANEFCRLTTSNSGAVYDRELNQALGRACYNRKNSGVICTE